ncbi:hypothetical protein KJ359_006331 [Pestalotiopsis sp. 9143b]|nr:hypothetical protein KJ359_006331 [Pestalotiopsis sp. 9143b]
MSNPDGTGTQQPGVEAEPVNGDTFPYNQFHGFGNLPTEIQLNIWDIHRHHMTTFRHYMVLGWRGRGYAALNCKTNTWLPAVADTSRHGTGDALDPREKQIELSNRFQLTVPSSGPPKGRTLLRTPMRRKRKTYIDRILDGSCFNDAIAPQTLKPWVNFHRDVVFFDSLGFRFTGRPRLLAANLGVSFKCQVAPDHWVTRIRNLAFYVDEPQRQTKWYLDDYMDDFMLASMMALQQVFMVFRCEKCTLECLHGTRGGVDEFGFCHEPPVDGRHRSYYGSVPAFFYVPWPTMAENLCGFQPERANTMRNYMLQRLIMAGKPRVEVIIVADVACVM